MKAHCNTSSLDTAVSTNDYPYGRLRCTMNFFVEYKKNKGWRAVTQSVNPKNGRLNNPHAGTYSTSPIFISEEKEGFFEFVYIPSYPDRDGKNIQELVDKWWNLLSAEYQQFIKDLCHACKTRASDYYANLNVTFPE